MIGYGFGDEFINDVAKANGSKVFGYFWGFGFGNEAYIGMVYIC